jgi:hypothetical protein
MNVGLVFGIIFAAILIGFIFIFGFGQIQSILGFGQEASFDKTIDDFRNAVSQVYSLSQGSVQGFDFPFPESYDSVCFVGDPEQRTPTWEPDAVYTSLIEGYGYNVIVTGTNKGYKIDNLSPTNNFCIASKTKVYLRNMGRYVDVEAGG